MEGNAISLTDREYLQTVMDFCKQKSQTGTLCVLRLWNLNSDQNEQNPYILTQLQQAFDTPSLYNVLLQKGSVSLCKNVYLETAQKFDWPDIHLPQTNTRLFCRGLRDQIGILCDGTVVPCCLDHEGDIPLGNLFNTPLKEIVNSPLAQSIYNGFSSREAVHPLCRTCGYATRFQK